MLKAAEGKAQSWKFRMAVMGVFSLVAASAVVGGRWLWASPKASEVLEGYSLEHCHAVTDSIHANMCQKQLFLVSATPALLCTHLGVGGAIEEVECCDGAQMNAEISATSGECNAQCLAQFSAEWRLDAPPFEATVYGSFEGGKCTCIDVLCIVQVEMDPSEDAAAKAQLAAKKQMDTLMLSLKKDSAQLKECGTDRAFAERVANDKEAYDSALKKMAAAQLKADAYDPTSADHYEIPVRFVSNGIWSDWESQFEIDYLNEVYSGQLKSKITFNQENVGAAPVRFVLAANDLDAGIPVTCDAQLRGTTPSFSAVNPRTQLNVMVCENAFHGIQDLCGIGVFPWSVEANTAEDVTIIAKGCLEGRRQAANQFDNRLLAHELGHTLGLWHTFNELCNGEGDEVVDTPKDTDVSLTCDDSLAACNGQRMAQNPMEYSQGCDAHAFTIGQVSRLTAWGRMERRDLWNAVATQWNVKLTTSDSQNAATSDSLWFCVDRCCEELRNEFFLSNCAAPKDTSTLKLLAAGGDSWMGSLDVIYGQTVEHIVVVLSTDASDEIDGIKAKRGVTFAKATDGKWRVGADVPFDYVLWSVRVATSYKSNAGTDDSLWFCVDDCCEKLDNEGGDDFERGNRADYFLNCEAPTDASTLKLVASGGDSWMGYLQSVDGAHVAYYPLVLSTDSDDENDGIDAKRGVTLQKAADGKWYVGADVPFDYVLWNVKVATSNVYAAGTDDNLWFCVDNCCEKLQNEGADDFERGYRNYFLSNCAAPMKSSTIKLVASGSGSWMGYLQTVYGARVAYDPLVLSTDPTDALDGTYAERGARFTQKADGQWHWNAEVPFKWQP